MVKILIKLFLNLSFFRSFSKAVANAPGATLSPQIKISDESSIFCFITSLIFDSSNSGSLLMVALSILSPRFLSPSSSSSSIPSSHSISISLLTSSASSPLKFLLPLSLSSLLSLLLLLSLSFWNNHYHYYHYWH